MYSSIHQEWNDFFKSSKSLLGCPANAGEDCACPENTILNNAGDVCSEGKSHRISTNDTQLMNYD